MFWAELDTAGIETAGYPFGLPTVTVLRELGQLVLDPAVAVVDRRQRHLQGHAGGGGGGRGRVQS